MPSRWSRTCTPAASSARGAGSTRCFRARRSWWRATTWVSPWTTQGVPSLARRAPRSTCWSRARCSRAETSARWVTRADRSGPSSASAWPLGSDRLTAVAPAELPSAQPRAVAALVRGAALVDAHDLDGARAAVAGARVESIAVGSAILFAAALRLDAEVALTLEHDGHRAIAVLDEWLADGVGTEIAAAREQAEMWRGAALLLLGQDVLALDRLSASVASMRAGRRLLELSRALIFLSEAVRRTGSAERARAQTDEALAASSDQGSYLRLVRGLTLFPKVLGARVGARARAGVGVAVARASDPHAACGCTQRVSDAGAARRVRRDLPRRGRYARLPRLSHGARSCSRTSPRAPPCARRVRTSSPRWTASPMRAARRTYGRPCSFCEASSRRRSRSSGPVTASC